MAIIDSGVLFHGTSGTFYVGTTGTVVPAIRLSDKTNIATIFNSGRLNTDFHILPTGTSQVGLFFDVSTSRLGINTTTPGAALHIKDVCADGGIKIESTDNCDDGVTLNLLHNPTTVSKSGDYPATINLKGVNTNDSEIIYAQIKSRILNANTSNTSGELSFYVDKTGIPSQIFVGSVQKIILGQDNTVLNGLYPTVIGKSNSVNNCRNFSLIGNSNNINQINEGLILGYLNSASGSGTIAITNFSMISGVENLVFGTINNISGYENIIVGGSDNITGVGNTLIGSDSNIIGSSGLLVGSNLIVFGLKNVNFGSNNNISGNNNLYYGNQGLINSGNNNINIGNSQSVLSSNSGIFIGNGISLTNSNNTIIIGLNNNYYTLPNSLLFGSNNYASTGSSGLVLFGQNNNFLGASGSLVFGQNNNISGSINNIVVGQTNGSYGNSNNNIVIGLLNNKTGIFISTTSISGNPIDNTNSILDHNILFGINNNVLTALNSVTVGNKNNVSGTNNDVVGSFNYTTSSGNNILGNSNAIIGSNNTNIGDYNRLFGSNIIALGNSGSIYGNSSVNIGQNKLLASGNIIGSNNIVHNIRNNIYGSNNIAGGATEYKFTINSDKIIIDRATPDISNGDTLGLYISNQNTTVPYYEYLAADKTYNGGSDETTFSLTYSQVNLFHIAQNFNDSTSTPSIVSGILTKIKSSNNLGLSSVIIGNDNISRNGSGIVIGNYNSVSGENVIAIGNNIKYTGDNGVVIGSTDNNKFISNNTHFIINPSLAQNGLRMWGNSGLVVQYVDFINNRVGINTTNPTYDLDVNGIIKASNIIVSGGSAGYVLVSDASGLGSWQKQIAITGLNNSLLVKLPDNTISGVDAFVFTPENTGINLFDSKILLSATGTLFNNSNLVFTNDVDDIILSINTNIDTVSGTNFVSNNLRVIDSVVLPASSLSGGLLYVSNNGTLTSNRLSVPNCLLFNNGSNNPDGDSKLRYISGVIAFGSSDFNNDSFDQTNYDHLISVNNDYNIVFNRSKNLQNNFSIWSNTSLNGDDSPLGVHYSHSGVLGVHTAGPQKYSASDDVRLRVAGKIHANSLKVGTGPTTSGFYLRAIDDSGNLALQELTLPLTQLATYPIISSIGQGTTTYVVSLSPYKNYTSATELEGGNKVDGGKTLVFNGSNTAAQRWVVADNFRARQGGCGNTCYKGIEFGKRASLLQTNEMIAFAGGAFKNLQNSEEYNSYNGSSQFAQYQLRTATSGVQSYDLLTDFPVNTSVSSNNTMAFNNTAIDDGHNITNPNRNYIWQYNITLNAIWQSGTDATTIDGGCFIYEGAIKKIGSSFSLIGTPLVRSYLPTTRPQLSGIVRPTSNDSINRLQILASGGTNNYHIKWSATAQINQINLPSGAFSFQF
jgi:hypothetical protein